MTHDDDGWHPSMPPRRQPRDTLLVSCDVCGKFAENLVDHYDREHPSLDEAERREYLREKNRNNLRAWRARLQRDRQDG